MKNNAWKKFLKTSAAALLAAGIGALATGCKGKIQIVPDDPDDQTQTDGNKEDLNNQGNQQGNQNQQGGTTPTEPDYSGYSPLLQDVLKSDYYNDLIAKAQKGKLEYTGTAEGGENIIENIPYKFLESQGEDIYGIKNNDYFVGCYNYVNNENKNELYTRIEIDFGTDEKTQYYKIYLIKHEITDKELKDFTMLTEGKYYQANFFIQELDNQREAELVNEFCINTKAYSTLKNKLNNNQEILAQLNNNTVSDYLITDFEEDEENSCQYVNIQVISDAKNSSAVTDRVVLSAKLTLSEIRGLNIKNNIYNSESIILLDQQVSSPTPITYFKNNPINIKNFIK